MYRSILFQTARELTLEEISSVSGAEGGDCTSWQCGSYFNNRCSDGNCGDGAASGEPEPAPHK
jgi:hypothetical protein